MLKVLDLFSGIGGFSLGLERAGPFKTVAFCEIEPFCQRVLAKHWPDTPIYNDVRNLNYEGTVDVICGGYPCQPFSVAGKRKGKDDPRHLWPFMFKLIQKHRPRWVIGENVIGHINMGLDEVLFDLESEGYTVRAFSIPACAVNAPHRRERIWIVGNLDSSNASGEQRPEGQDKGSGQRAPKKDIKERGEWFSELVARDVAQGVNTYAGARGALDGIPDRMDRLKALGNSVVPHIPYIIGKAILEADNERQFTRDNRESI